MWVQTKLGSLALILWLIPRSRLECDLNKFSDYNKYVEIKSLKICMKYANYLENKLLQWTMNRWPAYHWLGLDHENFLNNSSTLLIISYNNAKY